MRQFNFCCKWRMADGQLRQGEPLGNWCNNACEGSLRISSPSRILGSSWGLSGWLELCQRVRQQVGT